MAVTGRSHPVPDRLLGAHRWRNVSLVLIALAVINMALMGGVVTIRGDLIDTRRDLREAQQRLDAIGQAEKLTSSGACFAQAANRPNSKSLIDVLDLVVADIRKTTKDAIARNPSPEANKLRRERLKRIIPAEMTIARFYRTIDAIKSADECTAEAKKAGLSDKQIKGLRDAARAEDPR